MKGIVRKVDDLGRIVPPKEFRDAFGIHPYDPVDMYIDGERICIEPLRLKCAYCGCEDETKLEQFKGVHHCQMCLAELRK